MIVVCGEKESYLGRKRANKSNKRADGTVDDIGIF